MKKMKEDNVDGEDMKEKPKNIIINLTISLGVILATIAFAGLSGSDLVIKTAWYILIIHWVAFVPALIFKTEKFYDLTGSICYAFGSVFVYYQTYGATFSLSLFISIAVLIWTIRLGSFLLKRVLDAGEDKRFRTIKTSPTQFFMTFNLSALWVVICSLCALTAVSNGVLAVEPIFYLGLFIFISISLFPLITRLFSIMGLTTFEVSDLSEINLAFLLVVSIFALYGLVDDLVDVGRILKLILPITFSYPFISVIKPSIIWIPFMYLFKILELFIS